MNDAGICPHESSALAVEPDQGKALRANSATIYQRLSPADPRGALHRMHLIRRFEENAEDAYMRGLVHGSMHPSIGQEASAVGASTPLTDADYIPCTHRGHGHCIAKGADVAQRASAYATPSVIVGADGIGAEVSAAVAESEALDYLDAPIRRLGGAECPIPYNPGLKKACVPQTEAILAAARELADGRI